MHMWLENEKNIELKINYINQFNKLQISICISKKVLKSAL